MSAMADTPRDAGYGIFRRWNPEIDERDSLTGSLAFLQQAEIRFPCTCCLECETLAGANHRTHLLDHSSTSRKRGTLHVFWRNALSDLVGIQKIDLSETSQGVARWRQLFCPLHSDRQE